MGNFLLQHLVTLNQQLQPWSLNQAMLVKNSFCSGKAKMSRMTFVLFHCLPPSSFRRNVPLGRLLTIISNLNFKKIDRSSNNRANFGITTTTTKVLTVRTELHGIQTIDHWTSKEVSLFLPLEPRQPLPIIPKILSHKNH